VSLLKLLHPVFACYLCNKCNDMSLCSHFETVPNLKHFKIYLNCFAISDFQSIKMLFLPVIYLVIEYFLKIELKYHLMFKCLTIVGKL